MREVPGAVEAGGLGPPRRRPGGRSVVGVSLLAVGWLIVAVLGHVVLLRLVAWDSAEPLIVLNAVTFMPTCRPAATAGFVALMREGLTDGAAARGEATGMTRPNGAVVPPFVRIDHVLTGARLAVTGIAARPGFGSDHRYLVATVAIRPGHRDDSTPQLGR